MNFEFENSLPIYLQIKETIRILIISEKLPSGQRLPSVREWALFFKVNPNTLQKALSELEKEGLVFTERTSGRFVTENRELIEESKRNYAKDLTKKYFQSMREIGFDQSDIFCYLEEGEDDL